MMPGTKSRCPQTRGHCILFRIGDAKEGVTHKAPVGRKKWQAPLNGSHQVVGCRYPTHAADEDPFPPQDGQIYWWGWCQVPHDHILGQYHEVHCVPGTAEMFLPIWKKNTDRMKLPNWPPPKDCSTLRVLIGRARAYNGCFSNKIWRCKDVLQLRDFS